VARCLTIKSIIGFANGARRQGAVDYNYFPYSAGAPRLDRRFQQHPHVAHYEDIRRFSVLRDADVS
jgi:hypothetical protein